RRGVPRALAPVYARAALRRAAAGSRGAGAADSPRRHRAERAAPAGGRPLPHPVPAEDRPRVRGGGAAVGARERHTLDRVSHPDRGAVEKPGGERCRTRSSVFSREEYARRLAATRAKMRERDAEIVLVDEAEHLAYLTGFDRSATRYQACAIPLEGEPVMFLRALDEPSFLERSWLTDRVTIADWEDSVAVIARELRRRGWANRRIGLELDSNYLTVRRWQSLTAVSAAIASSGAICCTWSSCPRFMATARASCGRPLSTRLPRPGSTLRACSSSCKTVNSPRCSPAPSPPTSIGSCATACSRRS